MSVAAAVAAGRREIERTLLNDTCRIRANAAGSEGATGQPQTWPSVTQTVRCQVQVQRPTFGSGGDVIDNALLPRTRAVSLPAGTVAPAPYRIEWVEGGITLEVMGEPLEPGTQGMTTVVNCVEVSP